MDQELLESQADECRKMIPEFAGRPEELFLVQLVSAFEQLVRQEQIPSRGDGATEMRFSAGPNRSCP